MMILEKISIVLTERCNYSCSYCYQDHHSGPTILTETLDAIANEIRKQCSDPKPEIHFFGGEPLLRFPLIKSAVPKFREAGVTNFSITTNASLLTSEIITFLRDEGFSILISFDGAREAQEFRHENSYDLLKGKITALLLEFSDRPAHIAVNAVVTRDNIRYLSMSLRELVALGFRRISLSAEFDPKEAWNQDDLNEIPAQWDEIAKFSLEHFKKYGWLPLNKLDANSVPEQFREIGCALVNGTSLSVHPNGDLSTCLAVLSSRLSWENKQKFKIGNIHAGLPNVNAAANRASSLLNGKAKIINIVQEQRGKTFDTYGCPLSVLTAKSRDDLTHHEVWALCVENYKSKVPRRRKVFGTNRSLRKGFAWNV